MFLERGFVFTHETVRDWEARFAPLLIERLRAKRHGRPGAKWHADETYRKVDGCCCSLYRAIDREGNLVEALLREKRDMAAAQRFFARAPSARPSAMRWATAPAGTKITASSRTTAA